jgi:hypothetical protein
MFGKLFQTIVDVGVKLPTAIIADAVTFGGIAIDQPAATPQVVEQIIEDLEDLTTPE